MRGCSTRNGSFTNVAHLVAVMSFRALLAVLVEVDGSLEVDESSLYFHGYKFMSYEALLLWSHV